MQKKVLFVHDGPLYKDEFDNYYGIHYTNDLINRYLSLGSFVTFLIRVNDVRKEDAKNLSLIDSKAFNVIRVPNFKSFNKYFKTRSIAKKIISQAILDHDIIVARLPSGIGNLSVFYAQKYGKPLLAEMVACTFDAYWYHSTKGKLIAYYTFLKQKRVMKNIDYCIYVTKFFLQNRYPNKGKSISCSDVEINNLNDEILNNRLEKIKKSKLEVITLGSIGVLNVPYKGYEDALKALSILKGKGYLFKYKLVGQGDTYLLKKMIEKFGLKNEVIILGTLKHSEIFDFVDSIDVLIHPSRTEGLPRAPIEAMSRACPVIGSNAGGIPELISGEFTFEKGNVNQIVDILMKIERSILLKESKRGFNVAKGYQKEILDNKRKSFYNLFLSENFNL